MHIISAFDFPLFCSNVARKCLILPGECSPQKSLILHEILQAELIQAYRSPKHSESKEHFPDLEVCCDWSTFFPARISIRLWGRGRGKEEGERGEGRGEGERGRGEGE